ncbi:MAG TPA: hypothetical protein DCM08_09540 [Microscillaceae bacterium]|nr:hypothetical protein [Microscillaceae bacterium]
MRNGQEEGGAIAVLSLLLMIGKFVVQAYVFMYVWGVINPHSLWGFLKFCIVVAIVMYLLESALIFVIGGIIALFGRNG